MLSLTICLPRIGSDWPQELHTKGLANLREACKQTRTLCATVIDTLGPEIVVTNRCVGVCEGEAGPGGCVEQHQSCILAGVAAAAAPPRHGPARTTATAAAKVGA
jgi:hypothetical protein